MNSTVEPRLAPPGAGLPKLELFIGRLLFGLRHRGGDRDSFNGQFQRERKRIDSLVRGCDPDSLARRVLVARGFGMEDSSRHWSVLMTLEHLRIVHGGIARIIGDLTNNRMPEGTASTAAVKPSPKVTAAAVAEYEASCDALLAMVKAADTLKTKLRYPHPWFGSLDAHAWHALAAAHIKIHRLQIQRIGAGLRNRD